MSELLTYPNFLPIQTAYLSKLLTDPKLLTYPNAYLSESRVQAIAHILHSLGGGPVDICNLALSLFFCITQKESLVNATSQACE